MKTLYKPINFLKEVKVQLLKVSWPNRQELIGSTLVVITITVLAAIFIGIVDLFLSRLISWVFR